MVTVLDSFEDGDISEYSGDTASYSVVSTDPVDGSNHLEVAADAQLTAITRTDKTISPGETPFGAWLKPDETGSKTVYAQNPVFVFAVQSVGNWDNFDGYHISIDSANDEAVLARHDSGTITDIGSLSATIDAASWYEVIVTQWTSSGDFSVEVKDSTDASLGTFSATDSTYGSGGFGFGKGAGSDVALHHDYAYKPDTSTATQESLSIGATAATSINSLSEPYPPSDLNASQQ